MKKILIYSILLVIINNVLFAQDENNNVSKVEQNDNNNLSKVGSNLWGLILIEDFNCLYEYQIKNNYSAVSTLHYYNDKSWFHGDINVDWRFSFGGRVYSPLTPWGQQPSPIDLIGDFIQVQSSMMIISNEFYPTLEFSVGRSKLFDEKKNIY